jgi:hypothetical protein
MEAKDEKIILAKKYMAKVAVIPAKVSIYPLDE